MVVPIICLILVFIVLLPIYLHSEEHSGFKKATTLKLILSGVCSLTALLGLILNAVGETHVDIPRVLVVLALGCAFFGDYYLQFIRLDEKKYNIGIMCFASTQIFLIVFLCLQHGVSWPEFILAAVIVVCMQLLMVMQKWVLGRAKIPLSIYTLLLAFMTGKAVMALFGDSFSWSVGLIAVGAVLFMTSDVFLGINNYKADKRILANLNWITYFCGIFLIALSNWF